VTDRKAAARAYKETPRPGDPSHDHSADLRALESLWRDRLGVVEGAGYGNTLEDAAG